MSEEEKEGPQEEDVEEQGDVAEEEAVEEPEEVAEEEIPEKAEEPEEEGFTAGDFILVELTGRAEETGEVFDTTDEETAREADIYSEDRVYGPRTVVVGEGWVLRGLDERLKGLNIEETVEVEIPPEEAFGERKPENVRMVPYRVLRSKGVNPVVGGQIEVDGRSATVRSVGAGRVQLDYNHPLAGRNIVYDVKVTKQYEEDEEKIRALIVRRFLGADASNFGLKLLKRRARVSVPDDVFFAEGVQIAKRGLAIDILKFFPDFEAVEFVEEIKRT
jgi:peptidylprolyl isomerase